jgi:hypothetical protein
MPAGRLTRWGAALLVALGCSGTFAASNDIVSDFSLDSEGWMLFGDSTTSAPTHNAVGGNPGGFLNGTDRTVGGVWFWQAPSKFLGDRSLSFAQSLSFDLRMRGSGPLFEDSDVVLAGAGLSLHVDLSPVPQGVDWTSYSVVLGEAGNWRVGSRTGVAATDAQIQQVLGNLTSFRIRGEFITGSDNGDLDNVVMAAVPEPQTYLLLGAGLGLVGWAARRRKLA